MFKKIDSCRICNDKDLAPILDLGMQSFTGIFRKTREAVPSAPLSLVKCGKCHLVQLEHGFDMNQLYGQTYGYRSGLNAGMVAHLKGKVAKIVESYSPKEGDLIIDIGSNDATTLKSYPEGKFKLVGIDPTGVKFKDYYPASIQLIPDFFSAHLIRSKVADQKAKVITSIAMFYDLEDPPGFVQEIADLLADDGVWVFEQSYLPMMLDTNSYDTICHEHLEYYSLANVKWLTDWAGLKILDIEFNDSNGGSFSVTAAKRSAPYAECTALINKILAEENERGLHTLRPYKEFAERIDQQRRDLLDLLKTLKAQGKKVFGYGASTKGNVLLQYCNVTTNDMPYIAEVNEEKFGAYTPGTAIPIISEAEARAMKPDYFMVLPWHFRTGILRREQEFLASGGRMLFPLPKVEIVSST
jgi:hypothetical protein